MIGDEMGEQVVSVGFRYTGKLTTSALKKIGRALLNLISKAKNKLFLEGKQSLKHLSKGGNPVLGVEVSKAEIAEFHRYAKKYDFDYSLKRETNDPSQYFLFFKEKDMSKLDCMLKDFVNDKTLDNDTLGEKIRDAMDKAVNLNKARAKERGRQGKQKEKAPKQSRAEKEL